MRDANGKPVYDNMWDRAVEQMQENTAKVIMDFYTKRIIELFPQGTIPPKVEFKNERK